MNVLVTGGAGYIGSHTCVELLNSGYGVVVADNLVNSSEKSLERVQQICGKDLAFYEIDVRDRAALDRIFEKHDIGCVIHFAGLKAVGESVAMPLEYYDNNLFSTITLCEAMRDHGVTVVYCADSNINITSGVAPIKTMLNEGNRVMLGSDIAGGAQICMLDVIQMAIRTSKMKTIESDWKLPFLSVSEGFYLGTSAGAEYFGEQPGFAKGNRLHAVVIDDAVFPDTERLSLKERFERAVYLAHPKHIAAVYSDGRRVK